MIGPTLFDLSSDVTPTTAIAVEEIGHGLDMRPYQHEAYARIFEEFKKVRSTLLVMATGLGKTHVFSHVAAAMEKGRVLIIAHRQELIDQAHEKTSGIADEHVAVEMAERWSDEHEKSKIVIASVQTLLSPKRLARFDPHEFSLLIIDEAHHGTAASYRKILGHFKQNPDLQILGVTATPDRHDKAALGQIFESVAYTYDIVDAIPHGWLVPIRQTCVRVTDLDYSQVRTTAGDLNGADLAKVLEEEKILHQIASPTLEIVGDRKTLVFAHTVAQAERLCEIFNRHRLGCAKLVTGKTEKDTRRRMLADYAKGRFQFLVNVGVATEGFDDPSIQVIVMARPTKSRALFCQMLGRGTRPLPRLVDGLADDIARCGAIAGSLKPFVEVIDFVGNAGKHKLVTAVDILGGKYNSEEVERARANMQKKGKLSDVTKELIEARKELMEIARKEKERRRRVVGKAQYTAHSMDPFNRYDVNGTPANQAANDQPSDKQRGFLWYRGMVVHKPMTKKQMSRAIGLFVDEGFEPHEVAYKCGLKAGDWTGTSRQEQAVARLIREARNDHALNAARDRLKQEAHNMPHDAYLRMVSFGTRRREEIKEQKPEASLWRQP